MAHAKWYVGPASAGLADGTSWANRVGSLTAAEALALVAGDDVYVGPGVYRETLTPTKSGGSVYSTGTVSVTNGSKTVTGSGTTFTGNSFVDGVFQVAQIAHGTDGVTNGTGTFTSAAGNFQASMIGLTIRINTKIAAIISAVASATSITLTDPAGVAVAPSAGTALTYDVGPESPFTIASVDSNTQLTLVRPWSGPTLTGLAYSTWRPIRYLADPTGQNTDGIGGLVRITGSNDDKTITRTGCIALAAFNYRTFFGFALDSVSSTNGLLGGNANIANWIIEDCFFGPMSGSTWQITFGNASAAATQTTVRRCSFFPNRFGAIGYQNGSTQDNSGNLIENCFVAGGSSAQCIASVRVGGILIRNCTIGAAGSFGFRVATALTVGQAVTVNNCLISACSTGLGATVNSETIEDYNSLFNNQTDRSNTTVGQHSNTYMPLFQAVPLLANGRIEPWLPFSLLAASGQADLAGLFPPATDLYGIPRPQGISGSWGAVQRLPQAVTNTNAGTTEYAIPGRGYLDVLIPVVTGLTYTLTAQVRWDNNANIGVVPSMTLLADHGVAETSVSAVGSGGAETLTLSGITPTINSAEPGGVMVLRLKNNSTFGSVINAYFSLIVAS